MIALLYLVFLHLTNARSCGNRNNSLPQLTITVADISNAGTDKAARIWVRVLYGKKPSNAQWSEWQHLDSDNCDDLDRAQTDYFDLDLGGSTDQWLAIAFYGAHSDGLCIDSLSYWNGAEPESIDRFCGLIMGPSKGDTCFADEEYDDLCDNKVSDDPSYGAFWIDSDRGGCGAASISLSGKRNAVGTAFFLTDPGTPPEEASLYPSSQLNNDGMASILSSYSETISANLMQFMIVVSISVLAFMCGYYYFKKRYSDSMYKPLII